MIYLVLTSFSIEIINYTQQAIYWARCIRFYLALLSMEVKGHNELKSSAQELEQARFYERGQFIRLDACQNMS